MAVNWSGDQLLIVKVEFHSKFKDMLMLMSTKWTKQPLHGTFTCNYCNDTLILKKPKKVF